MATIYRPTYAFREEVRRALELTLAEPADEKIDRAILASSESVEGLTQRKFYTEYRTASFDYPNWQYAPPWKLYLDENELAGQPTMVTTGSLSPVPKTIPQSGYICQPVSTGPPFTRIEIRRDLSYSFGNSPTPQSDIAITGPFGYWMKSAPAGALSDDIDDVTTTIPVSGPVDVGSVLICGSERMLVTDSAFADSGVVFAGLSEASAADNQVAVPDGSAFSRNETLLIDAEWILIQTIIGNTLNVKRAWEGSVLASHAGGTLYASRSLAVLRGALGTVSAPHGKGSALSSEICPALIKELAIAEAVVWLTQEHGAYGGAPGGSGGAEPDAGPGLPDLRCRVRDSRLTRMPRIRAV